MSEFQGLPADMYQFFWEIAFRNDPEFFEANRERYKAHVQLPLQQLAALLLPTALSIDPRFSQRIPGIVSRIRRDTRYAKERPPFRDHAWLGFKMPGLLNSVCFVVYVEFNRDSYGYGMGMYAPETELMQSLRQGMLSDPDRFLTLVQAPAFRERFAIEGASYRKIKFPHENKALESYLNMRNLSFCFSSPNISRTMQPEIVEELKDGLLLMKPVYRLLMGLD